MPLLGPLFLWTISLLARGRPTITARVTEGPLAGALFELDPRVQADLIVGHYERGVTAVMERDLSPGDVCFDVGAHFGYFGMVMARLTGPDGVVVCFEPDPNAASVLEGNLRRNGHLIPGGVRIVPSAIGARPGRFRFEPGAHSTRGRLVESGSMDVEVITLDEACGRYGEPRLVKIDIEGGEVDALRGGSELLRRGEATLVIEIHGPNASRDCSELLSEHGYDLVRIGQPGRAEEYLIATPSHPRRPNTGATKVARRP
jgi:FkbM family methyltransferase